MSANPAAIPAATAHALASLVLYGDGAVVSRTLSKGSAGSLTLFAFDAGQAIAEHTTPFDAYVYMIEGALTLTIGGKPVAVTTGEVVLMPAQVPHALHAEGRAKMLLTMFKHQAA